MIPFVFALLYGPEDAGGVPGLKPELFGLGLDGVLPRELSNRRSSYVTYGFWGDVLVGGRVLGDAVDVQPAFVGEGAAPHKGTVRIRRQVHELRDVVGGLGEPPQPVFTYDLQAHLELQICDGRNEVAVAAALPDTVDGPLYVRCPRLYRYQGIRHPASRVVVGVDADLHAGKLPNRARHDGLELRRQRPAVRVTEDQRRRARFRGGTQHREGVLGVVPKSVEVVFGVEDDLFTGAGQVGDGVAHGGEVLLRSGPEDFLHVQLPALGDDAGDGRREGGQERHCGVVLGPPLRAPGPREGHELGVLQRRVIEALEELEVFGVGGGEACFDVVDPQRVELAGDPRFILGGQ